MAEPNNDEPIVPQGVTLREFDDTRAARKAIYDGTLDALKKRFPIENKSYRLELSNVRYTGPQDFTLAQQKQALITDKNLHTPVSGHFRLIRKSDNAVVDEKDEVVMNVPYYTDRGTIINNGSEYTVANQLRLRPGVYTRVRRSGDVETQFNVRPGTGRGFRLRMEPSTGVIMVNVGHANMPLYPLLRSLGVTDQQMIKAWGADVAHANAVKAESVSGRSAIDKLYQAFAGYNAEAQDLVSKERYLAETLPKFELDPGVTSRTLGLNANGITPEVLLRASAKMFNVNRGDEKPDDRDNPGFANIFGIEDLYRERIEKDAGRLSKDIMWKISRAGSLKPVGRAAFSGWHDELLHGSGLAMPGDNSNPMALEEQMLRATRLGEGGISSPDLLTDEARAVNSGNLNFIDVLAGPENCMPAEAEVMTCTGWVRWDRVTPDTEFACLVNGVLEYHKADALHVYDFDDELYCARSGKLEYRYTPNHRVWCSRGRKSQFRFEYAKDVHGKSMRLLMCGGHQPFAGRYNEFFTLPDVPNPGNAMKRIPPIPMRDWAAFMGWYLTEGCSHYIPNKSYGIHIAQQKGACLQKLKAVLDAMPFKMYAVHKVTEDGRKQVGFSGQNRQLCEYLHQFGLAYDKYIPEYLLEADLDSRLALFEAILLGDGRHKRDTFTFCSASRRFAETFERLAFSLGYTVHMRFEKDDRPISNTGGIWCVHVLKSDYHQIVNTTTRRQSFKQHYTGKVYCATVPGGLMYCRYGTGLGYWTGNSRIGADARLGVYARKGSDGRLYSLFINRQGRKEYIAADTASDHVIGFPGSDPKAETVPAMKNGKVQMVPRSEVDYFVPALSGMFSSSINLNPMPTAIQGGRQFYAAKFWAQYLPAAEGEVPLVASLMPDGKATWGEYYGRRLGTLKAGVDGTVTKVSDKGVTVADADGKKHFIETVTDFPFNGLTGLTYTPTVKVGDAVKADDMVAASNFVDKKTGALAMGRNMKVAWISAKGLSYEDSVVISEEAAKKLATNRLYGFESEPRDGGELGLNKFMSAFPKKFTKEQYATLDDNGVVKEGTVLNKGDPICVAVGPKLLTAEDATLGKLSKVLRGAFTDRSQTWEHDYPGTVVSSTVFRGRAKVNVKAAPPLLVGDKMCYDEETEVLTSHGWKYIKDVTLDDNVATLNPDTGVFDYLKPDVVHRYEHSGKMYRLANSCLDILVTTNHRLLVQRRGHTKFEFMEASAALGRRLSHKKDGVWNGTEVASFTFPSYQIGHRWGLITKPETTVRMDTFLMLLGMYLSEGSCYASTHGLNGGAGAGICISQTKPAGVAAARKALDGAGLRYTYGSGSFRLCGRHLYNYFVQFGHAPEKFIPEFVFGLSVRQQRIVFDWLMWGDGHSRDGMPKTYTTSSRQLADDVQRLCLHIGIAARICPKQPAGHYNGMIDGRKIFTKRDNYTVQIINSKLTPTVNHGHVKHQRAQVEGLVDYSGFVYCCTMPKWHAIYVRRNGHAYWCGNSPTSALKGTVGAIIPMDKMPRDATTNEPYDILMNPMGIPSRIAPGPVIESALGKLAKARGQQIRIPQEPPAEGWAAWAQAQLAEAGVSPTTDIFDPETGKTIKGVGDGYVYWHAMHHIADKKLAAKGGSGGYTSDLQPAKGGPEGAKRSCFTADQPIRVLHGEESIGHIVEKRIPALVWTRFDDGTWGYSRVSNWFCRKGKMRDVLAVTVDGLPGADIGRRKRVVYTSKVLHVTKNHHVYAPDRGEITVGDLRPGDWLTSYGYVPTADQMSLLMGSMLGDAAICNVNDNIRSYVDGKQVAVPYYREQHSHHQDMYVNWKIHALGALVSSRSTTQRKSKTGFSYSDGVRVSYYAIKRHDIVESLKNMFYRQPDGSLGRKNLSHVDLDMIGDVGIVSFFVDDGCVVYHKKAGKACQSPSGSISTLGFTDEENSVLAAWLTRRLSADVSVRHASKVYNGVRHRYTYLGLSAGACRSIAHLVARYMRVSDIPKSKKWLIDAVAKLESEYVGVDAACELGSVPVRVVDIRQWDDGKHGPDDDICLYDMTVDGSHKYCASDCLVSNSWLDALALLSHGATEVMKDTQVVRGVKNGDHWRAIRNGGPLPMPQVPFVYRKAMNLLRAGGINVVEGQKATDIMPMTDKATDALTGGRVIRTSQMLDDDMKDIPGGLFDPHMTGGSGNQDRWAAIELPEAIPNPVMEEPVRRVLGLTGKRLQAIISGEEALDGKTGGAALLDALGKIDIDKEIDRQKEIVRKSRGSARDNAVKVIGYLDGCRKQGVTPKDWMITKVPVIPPMFRPVARLGDTALISDINELYRDVIESAQAFRDLKDDVGDKGTTEERLNVYRAVKAAYGLGEPISPEGQAKGLKGAIRQVIGTTPKFGLWQSKVLSKAVDGVGRAVIGPEPNYDMDQCGIPEDAAWKLYRDYVIRGLTRRGYQQERAQELCDDRAPVAKSLLLEEMGRRPVILDRAPTWHKFNFMAFWPSLVSGSTLRMNPLVEKGFCADHDGDQMNFHVPSSDKAVQEAIEKMMPSKNLFSLTDLRKPRFVPNMEMTLGLAKLTAPQSKAKPRIFLTARDAIRAYRRGEIGANDPVSVLRP